MRVTRALISVSDKTGLQDFARRLVARGVTIISTGGTAEALRGWGIDVVSVDEVTGHPEIMGGRVKTLHPRIHGGILGRLDHDDDVRQMAENGIEAIDLVVVNLYPFEEWVLRRGVSDDELVEQIDIGGPALIRAAAKNHSRVGVVTSPDQYQEILDELAAGDGELSPTLLRRLAGAAYQRTARYDAVIADWFADPRGRLPDRDPHGLRQAARGELRREPAPAGGLLRRAGRPHPPARADRPAPRQAALVQQPARPRRGPRPAGRVRAARLRDRQAQQPLRRGRGRRRRHGVPAGPRLRPRVGLRRRHHGQPAGGPGPRGGPRGHLRRGAVRSRASTRPPWRRSPASPTRA